MFRPWVPDPGTKKATRIPGTHKPGVYPGSSLVPQNLSRWLTTSGCRQCGRKYMGQKATRIPGTTGPPRERGKGNPPGGRDGEYPPILPLMAMGGPEGGDVPGDHRAGYSPLALNRLYPPRAISLCGFRSPSLLIDSALE
ncbi:17436_t:CDS:2, partial [Funneliformis caledonium]